MDLGYRPPKDYDPILERDTDFVQTFRRKDGSPWPDGASVQLEIGDVALWSATLLPGTDAPGQAGLPAATWNVDHAEVNAVVDAKGGRTVHVRALYTDASGLDLVWFKGKVDWNA